MSIPPEKVGRPASLAFSPDGTLLLTDGQSLRPSCLRAWDVSRRPGATGARVKLPPTLNVTTLQDDRFVAGLERNIRQYHDTQIESLQVEFLGERSVRLKGRVADEETHRLMVRDAGNYYLSEDAYGERGNQVIDELQVTGRAPR